jgi:histidine triad (HIT) family protein
LAYDNDNIFAKILRGEIPCDKVHETDFSLAFYDANPQAPTHVLIIPKGPYISMDDFSENASDLEAADFVRAVGAVARKLDLAEHGYRILANHGEHAHQEVPHLHLHLFGGHALGPILKKT